MSLRLSAGFARGALIAGSMQAVLGGALVLLQTGLIPAPTLRGDEREVLPILLQRVMVPLEAVLLVNGLLLLTLVVPFRRLAAAGGEAADPMKRALRSLTTATGALVLALAVALVAWVSLLALGPSRG